MKKKKLERYLLTFKGAESSYPFGPEALVFKVKSKMFALLSQTDEPMRMTLKCKPADAEILVSQYESIVPGYYMNKKHWITITLNGELPLHIITDLINNSYDLVVSKLSKSDKQILGRQ